MESKKDRIRRVKYWEIIVNKITKAGFSVGWVSAPIMKGVRSGLLTRIAATENVSLCGQMRS